MHQHNKMYFAAGHPFRFSPCEFLKAMLLVFINYRTNFQNLFQCIMFIIYAIRNVSNLIQALEQNLHYTLAFSFSNFIEKKF